MLILNCFVSEIYFFPGRYFIIILFFNHSNVKYASSPEYSRAGQTSILSVGMVAVHNQLLWFDLFMTLLCNNVIKMFSCRSCQPCWGLHCFLWREESLVWVQNTFTKRFLILNFLMNKGWQRAPTVLPGITVHCPGSPGHGSRFVENTAAEKLVSVHLRIEGKEMSHTRSHDDAPTKTVVKMWKGFGFFFHCGYTSFPSSFPPLHYCCALLHSTLLRVSVINCEIIKTCSKITEGLLYMAKENKLSSYSAAALWYPPQK